MPYKPTGRPPGRPPKLEPRFKKSRAPRLVLAYKLREAASLRALADKREMEAIVMLAAELAKGATISELSRKYGISRRQVRKAASAKASYPSED